MSAVESLAVRVLRSTMDRWPGDDPEREPDWGVPLLASLVGQAWPRPGHGRWVGGREVMGPVVLAWASRYARGAGYPGVYGRGLAGCALGLGHAARVEPRLARAARLATRQVAQWGAQFRWDGQAGSGLAARDYDLISGVAGVTAALAALDPFAPRLPDNQVALAALVGALVDLCDSDDLDGLRIRSHAGIELARWNVGTVNVGLAHGVPGVLAALVAAWPLLPSASRPAAAQAIRRVARWLVRHGCRYGEVHGWPFAVGGSVAGGGHGPSSSTQWRRQAWCYGTPGVAWQIAEAGRVLADGELREVGVAAMASLCVAWDDDYHLDASTTSDRLAFCHGAAGVLAVSDAFALHCGLLVAGRLADHLAALVARRLPEVGELARRDLSALSGASGVLSVLLSRDPDRRGWLCAVGLR